MLKDAKLDVHHNEFQSKMIEQQEDDSPGITKGFYLGQWTRNDEEKSGIDRDEMRHGRGKFIWEDGSIFEGYWLYDKMNGYGRKIFSSGCIYIGMW